ncbi:cullin-2-like [Babylonia areolata]|uniref:cullin-2-like n=1 Tax=Babylonia areolata TaxID=304850 RepID=UPI003FD1C268
MSLKPRRVEFEEVWPDVLKTVQAVITCDCVDRKVWNERFSDVYKLCTALPEPQGDRLYTETKAFLENHVTNLYNRVHESEHGILPTYYHCWEEYSRGANYLNQLFGYLNTTFIKKQKFSDADLNYGNFTIENNDHMLEIGELAMDIWRKNMIQPQRELLTTLLLGEISRDRQGQVVVESVVQGVVSSLVEVEQYKKKLVMQLYEDMFEFPFLRECGDYYRADASGLKANYTCSEYMEKVLQRLDQERIRSTKFLHPSSVQKVNCECQQRMVADHLQFLHGETPEMVRNEKQKDLSNMYKLMQPLHMGFLPLVDQVQEHIRITGLNAVRNLKQDNLPSLFVEAVLGVHKHFTDLIRKVFNNDQLFVGALDKACAAVINHKTSPKTPCRSPELLAKYCDILLKKSSKLVSDSDLDERLSRCVTVFKYLDDKDIFQRFYARMLAKRLIYYLSQSMDAEESMINKLKQACGYEFTNKLHRMFTDMSVSNDHNAGFQKFMEDQSVTLDISFSVMVLQAGAWPISATQTASFRIPQELEKTVRTFDDYYSIKFSGRKLTWLHNYCTGELKLNYLKRPYIVNMAGFLMGILLSFNASPKQTFAELSISTGLPCRELTRHLTALCETKLLQTEGEVTEKSVFSLNMEYTSKRTKFKINVATSQKETPQDVENTHAAVDDDRKMFLQAAIVRIMKARKILRHTSLIQEVITQSTHRFHPSISMIKKCIEALIDKQYLERQPQSPDEYSYVA